MPPRGQYLKAMLLALVIGLGQAAVAQSSSKQIDAELNKCLDNPQASTMDMLECYGSAYKKMDHQLNVVYKSLMAKLPKDKQIMLRNAQKRWVEFRDAELKLSVALDPSAGGSLGAVNRNASRYEFLKVRAAQLEAYLADIEENEEQ